MRLSTNTIYQSGTNRLIDLQADLSKLNNQISTGRRVVTPADDPVAAARIQELSNAKDMNTIYTNTRKVARTTLETYEANLTSVTSVVQDVQTLLTSAGNGTYSDEQRASIATELQNKYETLLGLANLKNSQGNFMYSGYNTGTKSFDDSGTYQGNTSRMKLQVEVQSQMKVTFSGDAVFQANGNDVFSTLQSAITLLNTDVTDAATQTALNSGLADGLNKMQGVLDQILNVRAEIGSKLNQLDTLDGNASNLDLQYENSLSSLQDLDYNQALSDLSKKNAILEAAQKSFVSTTKLSLFDFI